MSCAPDNEFINGLTRQSMGLQDVENLHMNFNQAREFVNGASRQSMGIDEVSNLHMNVPVAHVMRSVANNNFIEGTFIGNNATYVDLECPFEPSIALAFSDELVTNPGAACIISLLILKNLSAFNTLRYNTETGVPVAGGGRKITLLWNYENCVLRLDTQFSGTAYRFLNGYTYKYYLFQ